jgi:hypothetical protein
MPKKKEKEFRPEVWANLERLYGFALLGGYKITPFSTEPIFEDFRNIAIPACGEEVFCAENGLLIELHMLNREYGEPVFSVEYALQSVEAAKDFVVKDCELNSSSEILLRTAQRRYDLSETTMKKIVELAKTIAQFDRLEKVELVCVAEAIMFCCGFEKEYNGYNLMLPEFKTIMGVNVPVYLLNPENKHDLLSFIDELKKFL